MPILVNRGGEVRAVNSADELEAAIGEGFGASSVPVRDPISGRDLAVPASEAAKFLRRGYSSPSLSESFNQARTAQVESQYGGALDTVQTFGERGLGTLTLGLSDALASDDRQREMRLRTEANPNAGLAGEVVGGVAALAAGGSGALAKGVTALPAGAVTRGTAALGERLAARAGAGAVSKIAGAGIATGLEGVAFGVGQGVTELSLSDDPVTAERLVSVLGEKALYGGAIGGALGIFGKAAELGLKKAGKVAGEYAEGLKNRTDVVPEDGLAPQLTTYRSATDRDVALALDGAPSGKAWDARSRMGKLADTPKELERTPWTVRKHLEKESEALREAIADDKFLARVAKEEDRMAGALDSRIKSRADDNIVQLDAAETRKFVNWKNGVDPESTLKAERGATMSVDAGDASKFRDALRDGQVASMRREAYERLPQILEQNEKLYALVEELDAARRAGKGLVGSVASNVASTAITGGAATVGGMIAGPAGAMVGGMVGRELGERFTGLVSGRLGKAGAEVAGRASAAIGAFADTAAKATPMTRRGALQVLSGTSYAPAAAAPLSQAPTKLKLVASFRERERELRDQTAPLPDGTFEMRPEARERMAMTLAPLRLQSPLLADRMETVAARRIAFLASKLPRRPEFGTMQLGQDSWRPSEMEIASFARSAQAAQDPAGVLERLSSGNVTTEDAEAFRSVYPEWFEQVKLEVIEKLPEMQKGKISYKKKLALTIFTGVPMDPSFHPAVLRTLQTQFAEPGTEDGTAPKATPQFGSVSSKAFEPTPAQNRAG